jgi:recombinational DNA repair protein (RecF pathway)
MPTRREYMKALLAREESGHPHLFANILHAIKPILTEGPVPEALCPADAVDPPPHP